MVISYIKSKDNKQKLIPKNISIPVNYDVLMNIYKKEEIIDNIYLNLTNNSKIYLSEVQFSYTGKIIYFSTYNKINIFIDKNINTKIKWVFLFDSIRELSTFVDIIHKRRLFYLSNAIIITKELSETSFKYFNYLINLKIFIFYLEKDVFQYLVGNYDYKNNSNIYARLISINNKEYHLKHLYILILISLIILLFCIHLFRYKLVSDQRNLIFFFIRTVYFFPVIKVSISFLFIIKLKCLQSFNELNNIGSTNILTFLISSLDIFFKSLFITFCNLASKGIDETLRISSQIEFILFIRKFMLIYFVLSSTLVKNKYFLIFPNFFIILKFIFESIIFYLIYKNKKFTQRELIKRLNLAFLFCSEYIPSIKIKLKMNIWHFRIYFLYYTFIIFLIIYIFFNNISEIEKSTYFHFLDVITILFYCLLYRPRKWPEYFEVYFKKDFNYFENIYTCKILKDDIKIKERNNSLLFDGYNSDDSDIAKLNISETITLRSRKSNSDDDINIKKFYNQNSNCPIVILNPEFFYNISKNRIANNKEDLISYSIKYSVLGTYDITN